MPTNSYKTIGELQFTLVKSFEDDKLYKAESALGIFTVLDRMTGYGYQDVETAWRDSPDGTFYLASGNVDIRKHPELTLPEAITYILKRAY